MRDKYSAAHDLKNNDEFILRQWGDVLRDIARTKEGSIFLFPSDSLHLRSLIRASMFDQALLITGEEADTWFTQAYEKYEAAIALKPSYNICLNNWGLALR